MKKIKLSTKAVLSLGLSAVLFCMPAVGFALNGNYAVNVHAEDSKEQEAVSEEPAESTGQTEADTEQSAEGGTEESTENTYVNTFFKVFLFFLFFLSKSLFIGLHL